MERNDTLSPLAPFLNPQQRMCIGKAGPLFNFSAVLLQCRHCGYCVQLSMQIVRQLLCDLFTEIRKPSQARLVDISFCTLKLWIDFNFLLLAQTKLSKSTMIIFLITKITSYNPGSRPKSLSSN